VDVRVVLPARPAYLTGTVCIVSAIPTLHTHFESEVCD
jgi:hypothetical protein